jgi:hypothetical protein
MDPISISLSVLQLYEYSMKAYDLYLAVKDFPPTYLKLRLGLEIERQRLDLWARQIIHNQTDEQTNQSPREAVLWNLFRDILTNMIAAFEGSTRAMEEYKQYAGFPKKTTSAGGFEGCNAASAH